MADPILTHRHGAVRWLVFNNPAKHNAMNLEMNTASLDVIAQFARADDERVLVITGAGEKAFMSGADISEFEGRKDGPARVADFTGSTRRLLDDLRDLEKPTVAMIRGYCLGGGLALATACDIRIAAADAIFGIPAARLSIGYSPDLIKLLIELVGPSAAKEILYTARRYSAEEAVAMGLVNRRMPGEALESYIKDYCAGMAELAPLTQRATKLAIAELCNGGVHAGSPASLAVDACSQSEDFREATRAFLEKRKPVFKGR